MNVPMRAERIVLGIDLQGSGRAWMDDLKLEVPGTPRKRPHADDARGTCGPSAEPPSLALRTPVVAPAPACESEAFVFSC